MSLEVLDKTQITKEFFEAFPTIKLREQGTFLIIANPSGVKQDDSHLPALYRYLLIHPEIEKLDLSNNNFIFDEDSAEIINGIFQRLSYLNLSGNSDIFLSSFEYLQVQPKLTYLDISNAITIIDEAEEANGEFIHGLFYKLPNLASLMMKNNRLDDTNFPWIVPNTPLPMLQKLQCLNLNGNTIGSSILAISSFKRLRELHLKRNPAQSSLRLLKQLLPMFPELNCLEISPREGDMPAISKFLSETNINSLHCNNQSMSQRSAETLSNNPRLTTLEIAPSKRNKTYEPAWPLAFLTNLTLRNVTIAYPSCPQEWSKRTAFLAFITCQSSGFKTPLDLCLSEYLPSLGQRNQVFQRDALSTVNAQLLAYIKIEHLSRIILSYLDGIEVAKEEQERRKKEFTNFIKDNEDLHKRRYILLHQQLKCIYEALCIVESPGMGHLFDSHLCGIESMLSGFPGCSLTSKTLDFYEKELTLSASSNVTMAQKKSNLVAKICAELGFFNQLTKDQKDRIEQKIQQMPEDKGMPPLPEGRTSFGFD